MRTGRSRVRPDKPKQSFKFQDQIFRLAVGSAAVAGTGERRVTGSLPGCMSARGRRHRCRGMAHGSQSLQQPGAQDRFDIPEHRCSSLLGLDQSDLAAPAPGDIQAMTSNTLKMAEAFCSPQPISCATEQADAISSPESPV